MPTMSAAAESPRPSRLSEIGEESRKRILDAAEALFTERGVSDTSFAGIEREAGISRGSIPWHFKNKSGLLAAIVERATLMTAFEPPSQAGRAGVREALERSREVINRPQMEFLISLLAESIRSGSATHDTYRDWHDGIRRGLAALVAEDPAETPLPDGVSADAFATVVLGAMIGIHQQWRLAPDLVDLDASLTALELLIDAVFGGTDLRP